MSDDSKSTDESDKNDKGTKSKRADAKKSGVKDKLGHLARSSKVLPTRKNKNLLGLIVAGVVVVLIFCLMVTGGHHKVKKQTVDNQINNSNFVLEQNAKKLAELRGEKPQKQMIPEFGQMPSGNNDQDSREMKARRNSPTQMYSANPLNAQNQANGNSGGHSVLSGGGEFSKFANNQGGQPSVVGATHITHPHYTIAEGEFLHAVLETAIDSDMPGMVRAEVTRPVYAYIGEKPLIPAGSRLIGQYASLSSNGQSSTRVFVMWNRVITPSGISIMINSTGTDALGRAGMGADSVDTHFWRIFGTAALLSVMGASTATSGVSTTQQPNSADMYRQSVAAAFQQAAQASLKGNMNIKPTLHIHQGDSVNVFVAHDLDLYGALGQDS